MAMPDRAGERGAAALETAATLGVFAVLMFGIVQLGFLFYRNNIVHSAAAEAAHAASVCVGTDSACRAHGQSSGESILRLGRVWPATVTVSFSGSGVREIAEATVSSTFRLDFPFGRDATVTASASLPRERRLAER